MKCSVHEDQTVIMVCQSQQCETSLVCVLCIAGPHKGHEMSTLEEAGKASKKRLQDTSSEKEKYLQDQKKKIERINRMEQDINGNQKDAHKMMAEQGQRMRETVDKVIANMTSKCDVRYERRLRELKGIKHRTGVSIVEVQASQERLGQILETDDWIQIIQDEKKSKASLKVDDLPEDTTPDVGAEEINETLVTGVLAALQQSQHPSRSVTEVEHTSDFEGTVYRHKSLQPAASFSLPHGDLVRCIAPCQKDQSYIMTYGKSSIENYIYLCDKKGFVIKRLVFKSALRGMVITDNKCLLVNCNDEMCVKKMTFDGKQLNTFSTDPLMPNQICVASNGDILVTLVSSLEEHPSDTVGVVSRYTPQGKRMLTFERDRFGNSICPKYIAASRISDLVVVTTITNKVNHIPYSHVIVMTGDLQVKFRYLSDRRVIPGDQQYNPDISTKHFIPCIDHHDNMILGDALSGSIEIIDKCGQRLQCLGQVDEVLNIAISRDDDELWIGKSNGKVEVLTYT